MSARPIIDYVYILGASHSGSTLLALLLNAHPDITTIGETAPGSIGDVGTYRCSCGRLIKECSFWANVVDRMQEKHPDFNLDNFGTQFEFPSSRLVDWLLHIEHRGAPLELLRDAALRLSPAWQRVRREIESRCYDLASAALTESGGRILVDSSKLAHRLKFLLRIPEFNIRVIHLIRDGRAVALTYMRQDEFADSRDAAFRRGGRGMAAEATADSLPMAKAAYEWRRCLEAAQYVLAGLEASQWMEIHYEQLCSDKEGVLRRIHEFLGTDHTLATSHFRDVENHVVGNGMRLDTTSEIRLDERWREILTERDLRTFNQTAGAMNRCYGYV